MNRLQKLITFSLGVVLLAAGCNISVTTGKRGSDGSHGGQGIKGSGVTGSELREVGEFTALSVQHAIQANVTIGPEQSVTVQGDDNLVPLVETRISNGQLHVGVSQSCSPTMPLQVTIVVPHLERVESSSASQVTLSGELDKIELQSSSASTIDGSQLTVQEAAVDASSASTIKIRATELIRGSASSASTVTSIGKCQSVQVDTSSAASVRHE